MNQKRPFALGTWTLMLCLGLGGWLVPTGSQAHTIEQASQDMADAAQAFLASLKPDQKKIAHFDWKDEERQNWHFIPKDRKGLGMNTMTPPQKQLAMALLASGMSQRGHIKAVTIMSLEAVLQELEGPNRRFSRDPELYHVSIFGKPKAGTTWGWRLEGHHLSINFTLIEGKFISATPSFFGTNPADIKTGPRKGLRALAKEEDLARQLVKSLDADQRKQAIIADKAPRDILTGADRKVKPLKDEGLLASSLTATQKKVLGQLIEEYVRRHRPAIADIDLKKIRKHGLNTIRFAWAGGVEPGDGHYYRVQGPSFLLEYDSTQNQANHVHSVWRDFDNDFGEDLLRKHYKEVPHP